jgi:putative inorganic carbon (HCO3(-)) transporter
MNVSILGKKTIHFGLFLYVFSASLSLFGSEMGIAFAFLGWMMKMIGEKKFAWKKSPLDIPIALYLLSQIIASVISINAHHSLVAVADTEWIVILYFTMSNNLDDMNIVKKLLVVLVVISSFMGIYGIWQYYYGYDILRGEQLFRIKNFEHFSAVGNLGLHHTYAGIQTVVLFLTVPFFVFDMSSRKKISLYASAIILMLSVFVSHARAMYLGIVGGGLFFGFVRGKKLALRYMFIAGVGFVMFSFFIPSFYVRMKSSFSATENENRLQTYVVCWRIIQANPVFGTGVENYTHYYKIYNTFEESLGSPHNDYFNVAVNSGFVGLICFLFLWGTYLFSCIKNFSTMDDMFSKYLVIGAAMGVVSMLVGGLFQGYYTDLENGMLWWFVVGMSIAVLQMNNKQ